MTDLSPFQPLHQVISRQQAQVRLRRENRYLMTDALTMVLALALAVLVFFRLFGIRVVNGSGMFPAATDGDLVLGYREFTLRKNDAVFYTVNGREYMGRVAAKGGDSVDITAEGILYVNGTPQTGEITYPTYPPEDWAGHTMVPEGFVFVLGDYRTHTTDSRQLGLIPIENVTMKAAALLRHRGI